MRILYFSKDYSPHDHRFLSALAETEHEVFYLKLERNLRQTEDRPVPSQIQQVLWKGGQDPFRWRDAPSLTLNLKRVIKEIKPDLIYAGPIQTCAFLAVLSGFHPILTMSWGFDLMQDAERNEWMKLGYKVHVRNIQRSFTSDAQITRQQSNRLWDISRSHSGFSMGRGLETFLVNDSQDRRNICQPFVLFCNRSWEPRYGVDVLAKAFVKRCKTTQ